MTRFVLGLAALTALVLLLNDGLILFTRPLWVDEWLTVFVTNHSSPLEVMSDLMRGADGGASLFHLLMWAVRQVVGPLTPTVLHTAALLSVLGAVAVVYAVLRRRFSIDASIAGALAVGTHSVVIEHAFEGRFYGPWLLCLSLFALALSLNQESSTRGRRVFVGLSAIMLCTIHWYGVITLGMMTTVVVASHARSWRTGLRLVAPAAAAIPVLLAMVPLALAERSAYTIDGWIADFKPSQILGLSRFYWHAMIPAAAALGVVVGFMIRSQRNGRPKAGAVAAHVASDAGIIAITSLALTPLVLALLSMVALPSMITRYALPTALAWAPWVAFAAELLGRIPARVIRVLLAIAWFVGFAREAASRRNFTAFMNYVRTTAVRAGSANLPLVFQSIHIMYPALAADWVTLGPRNPTGGVFLELPDSVLDSLFPPGTQLYNLNKGIRVERDHARIQSRVYGYPRLIPKLQLDTTERFLFFAPHTRLPAGYQNMQLFQRAVLPSHQLTQIAPELWLAELRPPVDSVGR